MDFVTTGIVSELEKIEQSGQTIELCGNLLHT